MVIIKRLQILFQKSNPKKTFKNVIQKKLQIYFLKTTLKNPYKRVLKKQTIYSYALVCYTKFIIN